MKATVTGLLVLLGAAGLALFGIPGLSNTVWTEDITETISVDLTGAARMEISTDNGKIAYAGDDAAPPQVTITRRGGGKTVEQAEAALQAIEIVAENEGDLARLYWRWKEDKAVNWRAYVSFDVTGSSTITLDAITHNGSITVNGITGDLHAKTHNGQISAGGIVGNINGETHNGDIALSGEGVRLQGEAHNGSIDVDWVGAHIDVTTHNGGIKADLSKCAAIGGRMTTHNGSVLVKTGPATAFALDAESERGRVTAGVDLTAGKISRERARGSLHGGTDHLRITTHNGSIEIQGAE